VKQCSATELRVKSLCEQAAHADSFVNEVNESVGSAIAASVFFHTRISETCAHVGSVYDQCVTLCDPTVLFDTGANLWARKSSEILQLQAWLLVCSGIAVVVMLYIIKAFTPLLIILSIWMNLVGVVFNGVLHALIHDYPMVICFVCVFALKILWFFCIWRRLRLASALIQCSVDAITHILGAGVWIFAALLTVVEAGLVALGAGAFYLFTGPSPPAEIQMLNVLVPSLPEFLLVLTFYWALEAIASFLHVCVCCALGAACGVKTPATGIWRSAVFVTVFASGSVLLGSFMVAILKALEYIMLKIQGSGDGHPVRRAIVKIVCFCFISFVQTFNSFAFVFVGLKGMGYCHAAKALVAQQAKDPITAFALNETLNDVTQIAKLVAFYVSLLCAVVLGWNLGIIGVFNRSFSEFFLAPLLCMFLGALTSYSLTLIMGRLLEASLCTIFVIYGNEDWRCSFKVAQPKLFHKIDDAYTAMSTSIIPDCDCWCSCCSCCCCSPGQEDADGVSP